MFPDSEAARAFVRPLLEKADVAKSFNACRSFADRYLDGSDVGCPPQLFIVEWSHRTKEISTQLEVLMVPFNEAAEKVSALRVRGASMAARKALPLAVFLISEMWRSYEFGGRRSYARPADDPAREEMIGVQGMTVTGEKFYACRTVRRSAENRMVAGGIWEIAAATDRIEFSLLRQFFHGLFLALTPEGSSPHDRRHA